MTTALEVVLGEAHRVGGETVARLEAPLGSIIPNIGEDLRIAGKPYRVTGRRYEWDGDEAADGDMRPCTSVTLLVVAL